MERNLLMIRNSSRTTYIPLILGSGLLSALGGGGIATIVSNVENVGHLRGSIRSALGRISRTYVLGQKPLLDVVV